MRVGISSLALALLILGSAIPVSLPFSSAGNSQSILFGTIILEIIDVNVSQNTTHAGIVIDVVTTVNASWDVIDFSGFHVETYYDSQLIGYHVLYVVGTGQEIINITSVWNTTGVAPGIYAISAIAYGSNLDNYIDGFIQILPPPKTWIVDDDGTADFSTIQEAINAANDADTIFVRAGTYSAVVVNKSLTLEGESKYTAIIEGGVEPFGGGMRILANNVRISNFTIQHARGPPIRIHGDEGPSYGNITISDNIMTGCGEPVRLINTTGDIFSGNVIRDSSGGIGFDWANGNIVHNNTLINVGIGIVGGYPSYNNTFSENTIIGNSNAVSMNGIFDNNRFFHNSFINNTIQVDLTDGSNSWDNGYIYGGNFWSDYNGTDYDDDGIGDTPYIIDENNTDHYPLINPWAPPDLEMVCFETLKNITREGSRITFDTQFVYQGNTEEVFKLDVYLNGSLLNSESLILPPGHHWYTTRVWNTTGFAKGNYTVTALLEPLQDEVDTADNTMTTYVFITIAGDLNGDKTVDIYDAVILANHFGFYPWQSLWDSNIDMNDDDVIDIFDAILLAANYGKSWT